MAAIGPRIVIADTSVLVNFLRVDAMAMLGRLSKQIVITEHVEAEVAEHYEVQRGRLLAALKQNFVSQVALTSVGELAMFGRLAANGRLGAGECAAIACAVSGSHVLAIDDRRAIAEAQRIQVSLPIIRTEDLVVMLIREGVVSVTNADGIKAVWETEHRFRLAFKSFAELLQAHGPETALE